MHDNDKNLLTYDGTAIYYGKILDDAKANHYFDNLLKGIPWQHDEVIIFGRRIVTSRKTAWIGDENRNYTYSGIGRNALPWTQELLELKTLVEKISGAQYNSCLLNLYHNGNEGMGWHSDNEKEMGSAIASLSLGAERKFSFKHRKTKKRKDIFLENGSLLLMKGDTQKYWLHSLPKSVKIRAPRINITFRTII